MILRSRFVALLVIVFMTLTFSGIALAQADGPDPNSTVKERTPTPANDGKDASFPVGGSAEPTSPEDDATTGDVATPGGEATPLAASGDIDLAAMTLDSNQIPETFFLIAEYYTSPQEIADGFAGQVDSEALFATGIQTFYQSYYANADGNTLRTYIIAFDTEDGATAGFELFEDEETLVPNGDLRDSPGLAGVGESPAEITSGTIEQGDGTQQRTYDISYRIDRFEVGVAMETYDGSDVDDDLVDQLAVDLAERVQAVLGGEDIPGVDFDLPDQLIALDADTQIEGYQTASEAFLIDDPDLLPDGFVSGFYRGASFSRRVTSFLPFVTVGISSFESADDVEAALDDTEAIMPSLPDLDQLRGLDLDGADDIIGFSYSSPDGNGEPDSIRLFVQIDDHLLVIDVQGMENAASAEESGLTIADAALSCALDGECRSPVSIEQ